MPSAWERPLASSVGGSGESERRCASEGGGITRLNGTGPAHVAGPAHAGLLADDDFPALMPSNTGTNADRKVRSVVSRGGEWLSHEGGRVTESFGPGGRDCVVQGGTWAVGTQHGSRGESTHTHTHKHTHTHMGQQPVEGDRESRGVGWGRTHAGERGLGDGRSGSEGACDFLRPGPDGAYPVQGYMWRPQERVWESVLCGSQLGPLEYKRNVCLDVHSNEVGGGGGGGLARTGRIRGGRGEATGVDQSGAYKDGNLDGQGCGEGFRNPGFKVENVRIRLMVPKDIDRMGPINDPCPFTGTYTLHPTP
jgi:hypothetical protein